MSEETDYGSTENLFQELFRVRDELLEATTFEDKEALTVLYQGFLQELMRRQGI